MVQSIRNPDVLAEAACSANLLIPELKDVIISHGCFADTQAKTRSLLQIIEGKVKGEPIIFHQFLAVLRKLPGLSQLASQVQANYGMCMLSAQHFSWRFCCPKMIIRRYTNSTVGYSTT